MSHGQQAASGHVGNPGVILPLRTINVSGQYIPAGTAVPRGNDTIGRVCELLASYSGVVRSIAIKLGFTICVRPDLARDMSLVSPHPHVINAHLVGDLQSNLPIVDDLSVRGIIDVALLGIMMDSSEDMRRPRFFGEAVYEQTGDDEVCVSVHGKRFAVCFVFRDYLAIVVGEEKWDLLGYRAHPTCKEQLVSKVKHNIDDLQDKDVKFGRYLAIWRQSAQLSIAVCTTVGYFSSVYNLGYISPEDPNQVKRVRNLDMPCPITNSFVGEEFVVFPQRNYLCGGWSCLVERNTGTRHSAAPPVDQFGCVWSRTEIWLSPSMAGWVFGGVPYRMSLPFNAEALNTPLKLRYQVDDPTIRVDDAASAPRLCDLIEWSLSAVTCTTFCNSMTDSQVGGKTFISSVSVSTDSLGCRFKPNPRIFDMTLGEFPIVVAAQIFMHGETLVLALALVS